jgi:UDP-N-acetyl-D-galactosamine dehydrogenase
MAKNRISVVDAKILIMGFSFKENCPDLRNTRVIDIVHELQMYNAQIDIYDPWVKKAEARTEYGMELIDTPQSGMYDGILIAVAHDEFKRMGSQNIRALGKPDAVIFDVKYLLPAEESDGRL